MPQHETLNQPKRPWRVHEGPYSSSSHIVATFTTKEKAIEKAQGRANWTGDPFWVSDAREIFQRNNIRVDPQEEQ